MLIFGIDTCCMAATAALVDERVLVAQTVVNHGKTHSQMMMPQVEEMFKICGIDPKSVDAFAAAVGPGSFTGVRIGVSAVKGLAFGRDIKCVGVSTLFALALNVDDAKRGMIICPVMDARRCQFYNALFTADGKGNIKRLCEDRAISFDELASNLYEKYADKSIVLVGDGAELFMSLLKNSKYEFSADCARPDKIYQNAYSVAKAALLTIDKNTNYSAEKLLPVYLRLSQAERERNERIKQQ